MITRSGISLLSNAHYSVGYIESDFKIPEYCQVLRELRNVRIPYSTFFALRLAS